MVKRGTITCVTLYLVMIYGVDVKVVEVFGHLAKINKKRVVCIKSYIKEQTKGQFIRKTEKKNLGDGQKPQHPQHPIHREIELIIATK